jgi:putative hydrolase of the HAD superfamily
MIKALIIDYGNVLASLGSDNPDEIERIAQTAGLSVADFKQRIYGDEHERWNRCKRGMITEAAYRAEVGAGLTTVSGDWLVEQYFGVLRLHQQFIDYVRGLQGSYKLAILSNAIPHFSDHWLSHGFPDWFDLLINSSQVGLAKPDPEVFALVTDHFQLRPDECVFIDDQWKNIDAALKLGFQTVHFQSEEQAITELTRLLEIEQIKTEMP